MQQEVNIYNGSVFVTSCWQSCKGEDYVPGPYSVTFSAGSTSVSFSVSILNDDILEVNEIFSFNIISSSVPDQVIIGNPRQSAVIIVNDDSKWSLYCGKEKLLHYSINIKTYV